MTEQTFNLDALNFVNGKPARVTMDPDTPRTLLGKEFPNVAALDAAVKQEAEGVRRLCDTLSLVAEKK